MYVSDIDKENKHRKNIHICHFWEK